MQKLAAVLLMALLGCGGPSQSIVATPMHTELTAAASPSLEPTDLPLPSSPPLATPLPTVEPTLDSDPCAYRPLDGPSTVEGLLPGSAVKVAVTELNLREGPCTASAKLATLKEGQVLILSNQPYGPVKSNGYSWYSVLIAPNSYPFGELPPLPESPFPDGTDTTGGWIAARDGERPFVNRMAPRCPTTINLENVTAMLPAEWLACFDGPIVLKGTYGCGGCGGAGGPLGEPRWLTDTFEFTQIRVRWTDEFQYRPVGLHFRPSGPPPPTDGSIIRVTVHVDDRAAQKCSFVWGAGDRPFTVPQTFAVAWCRERLVVESYEFLRTDPNYRGG